MVRFVGVALALTSTATAADIELGWQGRVLDATGAPVNGINTIELRVYNGDTTAPQPVWSETLTNTNLEEGFVSYVIGGTSGNPFDDGLLAQRPVEVGIVVNGSELAPRHTLISVPYAAQASRVSAEGLAETMIAADCTTDGVLNFVDTGPGSPALRVCVGGEWSQIWPPAPGSAPNFPGQSCKAIFDAGGSLGDRPYWLDPNGGDGSDAFEANCDMTNGGWTELTPEYDGYSWRNDICGSATDGNCRPSSHGASNPREQFDRGAITSIVWKDLNNNTIPTSQLVALANSSTTTDIPNGEVYIYDTETTNDYVATFVFHGRSALTNTPSDTKGSTADASWDDMTTQNLGPYLEASGGILNYVDLRQDANWGFYIVFGDGILRVR